MRGRMSPLSAMVRPMAWLDSTLAIPARMGQRMPWHSGTLRADELDGLLVGGEHARRDVGGRAALGDPAVVSRGALQRDDCADRVPEMGAAQHTAANSSIVSSPAHVARRGRGRAGSLISPSPPAVRVAERRRISSWPRRRASGGSAQLPSRS